MNIKQSYRNLIGNDFWYHTLFNSMAIAIILGFAVVIEVVIELIFGRL